MPLQGSSLFAAARDPMVRLKDAVNETVHLAVPDGLHCGGR
jgi:IclR family transcriptional regulator, acetate operon repressor